MIDRLYLCPWSYTSDSDNFRRIRREEHRCILHRIEKLREEEVLWVPAGLGTWKEVLTVCSRRHQQKGILLDSLLCDNDEQNLSVEGASLESQVLRPGW